MRDHLAAVFAHYDDVALRPPTAGWPAPAAPGGAGAVLDRAGAELDRAGAVAWEALQAWCVDGAGPGGAPFWQPGALPQVQRRLALAQWMGPDAVVQAWALRLDGSLRMAAQRGRWAPLMLRLQTKADDACWWRRRRADDPWDAGYLIDSDAAALRLQNHFQPRRATLMIAAAMGPQRLGANLTALQRRCHEFRHPVRLLCLAGTPMAPGLAPAATRLVPPA